MNVYFCHEVRKDLDETDHYLIYLGIEQKYFEESEMKLTEDLVYEENGVVKIIPKGTMIENRFGPPDYNMEPPDEYDPPEMEQDDPQVYAAFDRLVEDGEFIVYWSPDAKKAFISDGSAGDFYEDEYVNDIPSAMRWIENIGQKMADKQGIEDVVYGLAGPSDQLKKYGGAYIVSACSMIDLKPTSEIISADSLDVAHDFYEKIGYEKAYEIASQNEPTIDEPDYEGMLQDKEDGKFDAEMDRLGL